MLDAYIIDAIRREQEERERAFDRNRIQLEIPVYRDPLPTNRRDSEPNGLEIDGPIVIPLKPQDAPEEDAA